MKLTKEQIEFIIQDVHHRGITLESLHDSLVDHLCCALENSCESNFEQAYIKALNTFEHGNLATIQSETIFFINRKKEIIMKKSMFILGYLSLFLGTTGFLFKTMHWPGAGIMLVLGIALFNLAFLPMFFYDRYKQSISK